MAAYDPASVAFNGVRIKSEPKDDDDVEMVDARPAYLERYPRNLYNQERAIASKRAKDVHGHVLPTMCFHRVHLDHPHHHILRCGHDIITRSIEPCGGNCMLSTEAESKPFTKVFECPHPTCVKQQATMRRKVVGRRCNLSHVYGRDLEADAARREQKMKYEAVVRVPMREKVFKNKRSPSPEAPADRPQMPAQAARPKAQLGGRVARVLTEIKYDRNLKALDSLAVDAGRGAQNDGKYLPPVPDDDLEGHECDCCDGGISNVRYHCKNCEAEFGDDLDLCAECYKGRKTKSWSRKPSYHIDSHSFVRVAVTAASEPGAHGNKDHHDQDFEILETYCICESRYLEHMLECDKCGKPHHIGCVGEGSFSDLQYRGEDADEYHEEDIIAYKSRHTQIPFFCLGCKFGNRDSAVEEAALKQLHDELADLRRKKENEKRGETQESDAKAQGKKRGANEISRANAKKRAAADDDGPDMDELFGEEDGQGGDAPVERIAKCAKTGKDVPTFGQFTVSMRN